MVVFRIIGIGIISCIFILVIKQEKPELAFLLSLISGLIILILVVDQIGVIVDLVRQLAIRTKVDIMYFNTIIKIIGIAYIGEFGAEITRDAGENALAGKIEMAIKIIIMFLAIPIMVSLVETIVNLIP